MSIPKEPAREKFRHLWSVPDPDVPATVAENADRWRTLSWSVREFGADGLTDDVVTELALGVQLLLRERQIGPAH